MKPIHLHFAERGAEDLGGVEVQVQDFVFVRIGERGEGLLQNRRDLRGRQIDGLRGLGGA